MEFIETVKIFNKMKKLFCLSLITLALAATSCGGSSNASGQAGTKAQDTIGTNKGNAVKEDVSVGEAKPMGEVKNDGSKPELGTVNKKETPKVKATPETDVDKLVKQYNDALVALITASKGTQIDEAAEKKLLDLKAQIDELDKGGKLSKTQKELVKVVDDTYAKLKNR
jgi:hypothetical protein